jgi:hypothetical protein
MITVKVKIDDKNILKELQKQSAFVDVGWFSGTEYPDGTPVASVAAQNEFGHDNVPPRPFFRHVLKTRAGKWKKVLRDNLAKEPDVRTTLSALADVMVEDIKDTIKIWTYPPNAASTIKKKGFNDPLVDTKRMMESVDWRGDWK